MINNGSSPLSFAGSNKPERVPVHRPRLPVAEVLLPYLKRIDETRWYTNFGPLLGEFELRLAEHFNAPVDNVTTLANGTLARTIGLRALGAPAGSSCLMPSWTFPATAGAVLAAGMTPHFVDVDRASWSLTPETALSEAEAVRNIGAVMVVSPFGAPLDRRRWDGFTETTGIPVLIDAAAGFDAISTCPEIHPGHTPLMVSLHATKAFGIGEGGLLISADSNFILQCRRFSNFGIAADRSVVGMGINAKLSEYAAAVGLAALDEWPQTRQAWSDRTAAYIRRLGGLTGVALSPRYGEGWISCYCNVNIEDGALEAGERLARAGIATRSWWGSGCHAQPAYRQFSLNELPVTAELGRTVLGLPFYLDINDSEIDFVVETLVGGGNL
jgi:dTDP-4-amino-4,6-dideoxygalactose transaminase